MAMRMSLHASPNSNFVRRAKGIGVRPERSRANAIVNATLRDMIVAYAAPATPQAGKIQ